MKVKFKEIEEETCNKCSDSLCYFFQLDGWEEDDWLCGDCFAKELTESEADYRVFSKSQWELRDK